MNWTWPGQRGSSNNNVLTDTASVAETRLKSIKKSLKALRKGIEDSLRTSNSRNRNEELEDRRKRCNEFVLGENVASAVHMLNEERGINSSSSLSPLNTILERYANFEKTIGHMLAANEMEIASFISSDTPIAKLLDKEIPAVQQSKKDLEQATKRLQSAQNSLEKERKKLERMREEAEKAVDKADKAEKVATTEEAIHAQEEKRDKLQYEVDNLEKEVALEQDKLTSTLLTLVSRENRYASSLLELMRIKKQFYENAFNVIAAELPNIERILTETNIRPVFGERLEDHLQATRRIIAHPIRLAVTHLRETGFNDEGLFRISAKQIKLDKVKAFMDANIPFHDLLMDGDPHLHSALLKSYLRELPEPLLGRSKKSADLYNMWLDVAVLREPAARVAEIKRIFDEELEPLVVINIQYLIKFLNELSKNCATTKMTPNNIAIVLGPTLLLPQTASMSEQANIDRIIRVVTTLIDNYSAIFPKDLKWSEWDDDNLRQVIGLSKPEPGSQGDLYNSPDLREERASRPNSSPPVTESHSPVHKRSNIFNLKFLSKINPPPSPKSDDHVASSSPSASLTTTTMQTHATT